MYCWVDYIPVTFITEMSCQHWIWFFRGCDVPEKEERNYAIKFSENRIKPYMLNDLKIENLTEMGITIQGDVMAILQYANIAYS